MTQVLKYIIAKILLYNVQILCKQGRPAEAMGDRRNCPGGHPQKGSEFKKYIYFYFTLF